ncbi:FecR domain-containing protein [Ramlibacter sp. H39-3-26]|uniref:FecR domain-containing protein n=1 Tax=Curvibacter soli TaxID=3031331 RepID=UPI0023DC5289|nr:FecR domain-containing protein [Ramlibacter sp. H39-3-26]MDF1486301.1 FecR domain-containing protein [Ramlibacter sp. H39-3-26]
MRRTACRLALAWGATAAPLWSVAALPPGAAAEILSLQGLGERRRDAAADWQPAQALQPLAPGTFVRTREDARMALLFADETQLRLHQNTVLQVKEVATPASPVTTLLLSLGRAWMQTRRAPDSRLTLLTPAATAGIRGTDWDMEVGADGRSLLTVFSGTVEFGNEQGQVSVGRNEAAVAEVGKAPVKIQLTQPRDRIQWVNALAADPLRHLRADDVPAALQPAYAALAARDMTHARALLDAAPADGWTLVLQAAQHLLAGDMAGAERLLAGLQDAMPPLPATWLMLSDIALLQGDYLRAAGVLQQGLRRLPGQSDLLAQLARAQLLADRREESAQTLARAAQADDGNVNLWLARGALARREGDSPATIAAYGRAVAAAPQDDRGWFGRGSAHTEREDTAPARTDLLQALQIAPEGPGYRGELGTLETFSNDFAAAEAAFAEALAQNPADYVALTGLGLLRLKQGRPVEALDAFLRAGVMEPRYARAKAYTGVAYWQLERRQDAIATLQQAAELDDKDPVPWLLLSQIYTDLFRPGDAVHASREAVARMPYLKSLNQLANNQQGRANLGTALAFFGMEDWALELAQQSNHPYWGGSHLFLADRYAGDFNKNSELFQGFLTDPLAFGASPRFSSLLQAPGTYGTLGFTFEKNEFRMAAPSASVNGLGNSPFPIAYFFQTQRAIVSGAPLPLTITDNTSTHRDMQPYRDWWPAGGEGDLRMTPLTVGLGARPTEQLGLFAYGNQSRLRLRGRNEVNPYTLYESTTATPTAMDYMARQGTLGLSYRWAPQAQTWVMLGRRTTDNAVQAVPMLSVFDDAVATLAGNSVYKTELNELHVQHVADLGADTRVRLGLQVMREKQINGSFFRGQIVLRDSGGELTVGDENLLLLNDFQRRFKAFSLGAQHRVSPALRIEGALVANDLRLDVPAGAFSDALYNDAGDLVGIFDYRDLSGHSRQRPVTPQFGMVLEPAPGLTVRAAYQDWMRPLGVGGLGGVETAGIPVEDQLVRAGGRHKRSVVQIGLAASDRTFLSVRLDHLRVYNPDAFGIDQLTPAEYFLAELRGTRITNISSLDVLEDTPGFTRGTVRRAMLGVNHMLSRQLSGYAKYQYQDTVLTGDTNQPVEAIAGRRIPYLPRDTLVLGATWASAQRVYLSGRTVYRSQRFGDVQNLQALPAGWQLDLIGYWESADKHWLIGMAALNLGRTGSTAPHRYIVDARYRF